MDIRVSHEEKRAFMEAVSKQGETASGVIRKAMRRYVRLYSDRSKSMIYAIRYPVAAAITLSIAMLGWQALDPFRLSNALAQDIDSRITLSLTSEQDGVRSRRDMATQIRQSFGEPVFLLVSESLGYPVLVREIGEDLENTGLVFRIIAEESGTPEQITYRVEIRRTSPDGATIDTLATPVLTVERAETARIEIGTYPVDMLAMELTPGPVDN